MEAASRTEGETWACDVSQPCDHFRKINNVLHTSVEQKMIPLLKATSAAWFQQMIYTFSKMAGIFSANAKSSRKKKNAC